MAAITKATFEGLLAARNYKTDNLFKGITDWGNVGQFNLFESGHPVLVQIRPVPFMEKWGEAHVDNKVITENFNAFVEKEFKGLDGIEDITAETLEVSDGMNTMNLINKVKQQSASSISIKLGMERVGRPITKYVTAFLKGVRDPLTHKRTYLGLLDDPKFNKTLFPSVENETATYLYYVTDNTGMNPEFAYLLVAAQYTKAETSMANATKGEHDGRELTIEMNCNVFDGIPVTALAIKHIAASAVIKNSQLFTPTALGLDMTGDKFDGTGDYTYPPTTK